MKIWAISDTHNNHLKLKLPSVDEVDMVIHAGDAGSIRDLSNNDGEIKSFLTWFNNLPYKHKIYIPGNHDTSVEAGFHDFSEYSNITVLIHESITIEGINIFGSPYTPSFSSGWAYNIPRHKLATYWAPIPDNTNIIVTHGPAKGILDYTAETNTTYSQCGCKALLNRIEAINPKYHIFGHIHDESGVLNCGTFKPNNDLSTVFVNACVMDLTYTIVNNGVIIEYPDKKP